VTEERGPKHGLSVPRKKQWPIFLSSCSVGNTTKKSLPHRKEKAEECLVFAKSRAVSYIHERARTYRREEKRRGGRGVGFYQPGVVGEEHLAVRPGPVGGCFSAGMRSLQHLESPRLLAGGRGLTDRTGHNYFTREQKKKEMRLCSGEEKKTILRA